MDYVAIRMLVGDRLKYIGLVGGLSFASLLITQQGSIFTGYALRTIAWLQDTPQADIWVMDSQNEFSEDRKPIADAALYRVRSVEGVAWAVPLYKGYHRLRLPDGSIVTCRMIGIDDATLMGGPPEMIQGSLDLLRQDKGVLVDETELATSLRLKRGLPGEGPRPLRVGDRLDINDRDAVVVGTFKRTPEFFWDPLVFTTYSRALKFAPPERKLMSYVMVKVQPGQDPEAVAARIRERTGWGAYTAGGFKALSMGFILDRTGILVNFGITIALGFVIGVLISGMLLYSFVVENLRYYAALKAMGATNLMLVRMIVVQTLMAAGIGYGLGAGAAAIAGQAMMAGGLAFKMTWQILAAGAAGVLTCSIIAALISLGRVLRLEPGLVFKA